MKSLSMERAVHASRETAWRVVSDVDSYARYAPNLDSSRVVSGYGVGMVRECSSKEGRWRERCTHWQDQAFYRFQVQTEARDYPYPFKTLQGKWSIYAGTENQTVIRMEFDFDFKNKFAGWLLYPILKRKYTQVCARLLDNWQQAVE